MTKQDLRNLSNDEVRAISARLEKGTVRDIEHIVDIVMWATIQYAERLSIEERQRLAVAAVREHLAEHPFGTLEFYELATESVVPPHVPIPVIPNRLPPCPDCGARSQDPDDHHADCEMVK